MNRRQMVGAVVAMAAAGLFVANASFADDKPAGEKEAKKTYKCEGGNSCKGQGACGGVNAKGEKHGCSGKNDCKGQGYVMTKDKKECETMKADMKKEAGEKKS